MKRLRYHAPVFLGAWFVFVVLLAGCSTPLSETAPKYAGSVQATCSPVDAAGIALDLISLGGTRPAQVGIAAWPGPRGAGDTVDLDGRSGSAGAMFDGTEWIPAAGGQIHFEVYSAGESAEGWFWIEIDGYGRFEGRFDAIWDESGPLLCG